MIYFLKIHKYHKKIKKRKTFFIIHDNEKPRRRIVSAKYSSFSFTFFRDRLHGLHLIEPVECDHLIKELVDKHAVNVLLSPLGLNDLLDKLPRSVAQGSRAREDGSYEGIIGIIKQELCCGYFNVVIE